jgi:hypothetical protein
MLRRIISTTLWRRLPSNPGPGGRSEAAPTERTAPPPPLPVRAEDADAAMQARLAEGQVRHFMRDLDR